MKTVTSTTLQPSLSTHPAWCSLYGMIHILPPNSIPAVSGMKRDYIYIYIHTNTHIYKDSAKSYPTLVIPRTVACQPPLSMGFSRQEYWSMLPFPSSGELPYPRIEPRSPTSQAEALLTELHRKPR